MTKAVRTPFKWLAVGCVLCAAIVAARVIFSAPQCAVKLTDGSVLKLESVTYGTNLFIGGGWIQRCALNWIPRLRRAPNLTFRLFRREPIVWQGNAKCVNFWFSAVDGRGLAQRANGSSFGFGAGFSPEGIIHVRLGENQVYAKIVDTEDHALPGFSFVIGGYSATKSYMGISIKSARPDTRWLNVKVWATAETDTARPILEIPVRNPVPKNQRK